MENEQLTSLFGLSIDDQCSATFRAAAQWGKVLSLLGFILGALMLFFGILVYSKIAGSFNGNRYISRSMQTAAIRYLIICFLFAGLFITGAIFTLNFSNKVATALNTSDQLSLNNGLIAIKNGIIFWAVIFIIFIILLLLAFISIAAV